jgi:Txe/YoeB family toxin of toxin-antitoxin system
LLQIVYTKRAKKDIDNYRGKLALLNKLEKLIKIISADPYKPSYEKLLGEFMGAYSRRINSQHRLVYLIKKDCVVILSAWTHYE